MGVSFRPSHFLYIAWRLKPDLLACQINFGSYILRRLAVKLYFFTLKEISYVSIPKWLRNSRLLLCSMSLICEVGSTLLLSIFNKIIVIFSLVLRLAASCQTSDPCTTFSSALASVHTPFCSFFMVLGSWCLRISSALILHMA